MLCLCSPYRLASLLTLSGTRSNDGTRYEVGWHINSPSLTNYDFDSVLCYVVETLSASSSHASLLQVDAQMPTLAAAERCSLSSIESEIAKLNMGSKLINTQIKKLNSKEKNAGDLKALNDVMIPHEAALQVNNTVYYISAPF